MAKETKRKRDEPLDGASHAAGLGSASAGPSSAAGPSGSTWQDGDASATASGVKAGKANSEGAVVLFRKSDGTAQYSGRISGSKSLAEVSIKVAKKLAFPPGTDVRLAHVRDRGREVDIWDRYDLETLRKRAIDDPSAQLIVNVYAVAGPSSFTSPGDAAFRTPMPHGSAPLLANGDASPTPNRQTQTSTKKKRKADRDDASATIAPVATSSSGTSMSESQRKKARREEKIRLKKLQEVGDLQAAGSLHPSSLQSPSAHTPSSANLASPTTDPRSLPQASAPSPVSPKKTKSKKKAKPSSLPPQSPLPAESSAPASTGKRKRSISPPQPQAPVTSSGTPPASPSSSDPAARKKQRREAKKQRESTGLPPISTSTPSPSSPAETKGAAAALRKQAHKPARPSPLGLSSTSAQADAAASSSSPADRREDAPVAPVPVNQVGGPAAAKSKKAKGKRNGSLAAAASFPSNGDATPTTSTSTAGSSSAFAAGSDIQATSQNNRRKSDAGEGGVKVISGLMARFREEQARKAAEKAAAEGGGASEVGHSSASRAPASEATVVATTSEKKDATKKEKKKPKAAAQAAAAESESPEAPEPIAQTEISQEETSKVKQKPAKKAQKSEVQEQAAAIIESHVEAPTPATGSSRSITDEPSSDSSSIPSDSTSTTKKSTKSTARATPSKASTSKAAAPLAPRTVLSCPVCGGVPFHIQSRCPIIKSGLDALEERLEVVLREMTGGRYWQASVEIIESWIKKLKEAEKEKHAEEAVAAEPEEAPVTAGQPSKAPKTTATSVPAEAAVPAQLTSAPTPDPVDHADRSSVTSSASPAPERAPSLPPVAAADPVVQPEIEPEVEPEVEEDDEAENQAEVEAEVAPEVEVDAEPAAQEAARPSDVEEETLTVDTTAHDAPAAEPAVDTTPAKIASTPAVRKTPITYSRRTPIGPPSISSASSSSSSSEEDEVSKPAAVKSLKSAGKANGVTPSAPPAGAEASADPETLPPIFLRGLKGRKTAGSVSAVSASTALIETESDSDSASDSESGSGSGSDSGSGDEDDDSDLGAETGAEAEEAEEEAEDQENRSMSREEQAFNAGSQQKPPSQAKTNGGAGEDEDVDMDGDDEADDVSETTTAAIARLDLPNMVGRRTASPAVNTTSRARRIPEARSGSETSDSTSNSGSDASSATSASTLSTTIRRPVTGSAANRLAYDALPDPQALFNDFFNRPLSQAERAEVKKSAEAMGDVSLRPDADGDGDDESVESVSEEQAEAGGAIRDDASSIGDFGSVVEQEQDVIVAEDGEEGGAGLINGQPPVLSSQADLVTQIEDAPASQGASQAATATPGVPESIDTASAEAAPLEDLIIATQPSQRSSSSQLDTHKMGRQPSTQSSSSSLESRRSLRFKQLDEEAGPSQRVGDLEGSIALEQARAEEATPEPASQLEVSAKVPIPASPDVEMEEDTATPKPRGRGRPLNISASQPVETASESRAGRRSSRLQSVDAEEVIIPASQQPTPKVRRASQLSQVSQARQSAPVPSGMDVLVEESLESAPVRSSQIDQLATSPLNSQTEPEVSVPAATTRRSTRASSRVSASPAPSAPTSPTARRGTRKATASIPPSSSTRPALRRGGSSQVSFQEEALESPLFMPQSQPLETQAYTLHAQTVSSSPPRDCPSPPPAAQRPRGRKILASPILEEEDEEDEPMATPTGRSMDRSTAPLSRRESEASTAAPDEGDEGDDDEVDKDEEEDGDEEEDQSRSGAEKKKVGSSRSTNSPPPISAIERSASSQAPPKRSYPVPPRPASSQPVSTRSARVDPPASFAPSLMDLPMELLRSGASAIATLTGFGGSPQSQSQLKASQNSLSNGHKDSPLASKGLSEMLGGPDSESDSGSGSESESSAEEEEAGGGKGDNKGLKGRYASASQKKKVVSTKGKVVGW